MRLFNLIAAILVGSIAVSAQAADHSAADIEIKLLAYPDLGSLGGEIEFELVNGRSEKNRDLRLDRQCSCLVGRLRYGSYILSVHAVGFVSRSVALNIRQPTYRTYLALRIGENVGYDDAPDPMLIISMSPEIHEAYSRLEVRLIPMAPPASAADGKAERWLAREWLAAATEPLVFHGLDPLAPYLLVVTSGDSPEAQAVVFSEVVESSFSSKFPRKVTVKLGSRKEGE